MRTTIVEGDPFKFFSDDSLNLIERPFYSVENDLDLKFMEGEVAHAINQFPCVSGLAMSQVDKIVGKSFGVKVSHPVSCFQLEENTFELLIYRFKPMYQSSLKDAIDEMIETFSLSTIELDFIFHEGNLQQFYGKYVEVQQ